MNDETQTIKLYCNKCDEVTCHYHLLVYPSGMLMVCGICGAIYGYLLD
jgi:hypothetical protein